MRGLLQLHCKASVTPMFVPFNLSSTLPSLSKFTRLETRRTLNARYSSRGSDPCKALIKSGVTNNSSPLLPHILLLRCSSYIYNFKFKMSSTLLAGRQLTNVAGNAGRRSFSASTSLAAASEVKRLGVIGAGQMVGINSSIWLKGLNV